MTPDELVELLIKLAGHADFAADMAQRESFLGANGIDAMRKDAEKARQVAKELEPAMGKVK